MQQDHQHVLDCSKICWIRLLESSTKSQSSKPPRSVLEARQAEPNDSQSAQIQNGEASVPDLTLYDTEVSQQAQDGAENKDNEPRMEDIEAASSVIFAAAAMPVA